MTTLWELLTRFGANFVWWTIIAPWEGAIRVRLGNRVTRLGPGIHIRIPHVDVIYKQTVRMRISTLQLQTLTSRDGKAITICATVGYCIADIGKLYNTLHHAEETIRNITAGYIAQEVRSKELSECGPEKIEAAVNQRLSFEEYGLERATMKIIDFAVVKTYRLISDQHWIGGVDELNTQQPVKNVAGPAI